MKSAILTYHSLDDSGSPISVAPDAFEQHCRVLADSGIPVVPLSQVTETPGSLAITFDDGFSNFEEHAAPALERYGLPATVFVVTGHCGGYNNWTQPIRGIPTLPLMSWEQIRGLPNPLVQFGGHTVTHLDLTQASAQSLASELQLGRSQLQDRTGQDVTTFAYPFGSVNGRVREAARAYYKLACGTGLRRLDLSSDRMELPRIDAYYLRKLSQFEAFVQGRGGSYVALRRTLRAIRAVLAR